MCCGLGTLGIVHKLAVSSAHHFMKIIARLYAHFTRSPSPASHLLPASSSSHQCAVHYTAPVRQTRCALFLIKQHSESRNSQEHRLYTFNARAFAHCKLSTHQEMFEIADAEVVLERFVAIHIEDARLQDVVLFARVHLNSLRAADFLTKHYLYIRRPIEFVA